MSTEIKEITGRREVHIFPDKNEYDDSILYINRFWGGKDGIMLQLTISNDDATTYIQLTEKQVEELSKVLSEAFNEEIYPSE